MDLPEVNVIKQIFENITARNNGSINSLNIRVKRDKDGEIIVAYTTTGSGEKRVKKIKLEKKKLLKKNAIERGKAPKPKSILKKED